jgi:hypothetical protein
MDIRMIIELAELGMDIQVYWRDTAYKDILAGRIHMDILYEYGRTRPN